ncbi:YadA C-terminal domain-containing protein [Phascolarctobacterium succinatutens]|uniref:YadA C-terminal domain-containing protein n=1 Tax=Phascolarctobacterium succinatutens TaxID=626940 RepID=UPI0026EEDAF5|nr:YadA C-terminal domain-containing protein [Phascolarctobacterium succinatutens]
MEGGKLVAKNGLYIGATDIANPTNENSKFYVSGENGNVVSRGIVYAKGLNVAAGRFTVDSSDGSFKAANGKFNVSNSGAITADSLTLSTDYNVKQNIEAAKDRITAVEGDLNTNKADLIALQGRVNGHDTDINTLKTKTEGITRVDGNSTTVDGVNFNGGAVSGVTSINNTHVGGVILSDGTIEAASGKFKVYDNGAMDASGGAFKVSSAGAIKALGIQTHSNGSITLNDKLFLNAEDASLQDKAAGKAVSVAEMANTRDNTNKISYNDTEGTKIDSDVIINAGKKNQVKITEGEGIVVGLNSSVINDDGVFAGGHDYNSAKAALNASDGSIKGANGAFGVDKDGNVTTTGDIQGKDITATGALKGQTLGIGGTGNDQFTVDENGAVKAAGGKVTIDKDGNAQFGDTGSNITKIQGNKITTGYIQTDNNIESSIGGVKMKNGQITADSMTINGNIDLNNLKVKDTLTVGTNTKITEGTLQLGTAEENKLTAEKLANINQTIKSGKVIEANSATIGGVEINGGNVTATGTIKGNTITDGNGFTATGGKITANEGQIGGVKISAAGEVTGVKSIEASTFKVDEENYLNSNGITAKGGKIGGAVIDATTLSVGSTKLDKADGITTNKLKIDGMTLTDTKLDTGTATFEVNGVTFNQGQVTAKAAQGFVAGTSSFKEGSLIVDANNKLEATNGLTTEKATVKGNLDVTGQATFGTVDNQTTINGKTVTTDTLKANRLILGTSGDATVEVDKDGSLIAAKGKFKVDKDGKTTFTKDADNLSSINGGNIWAKATDIADNTSSELTHDYKGLHIKGNKSGQKSAFDFDTASGIGTFTGQDNSTTKINGSAIRSEKIDGTAGKLDGENLTLYKDPNNQTTMSAGKATFTGDAGEKGGKVTTINGGTISTDTLNVERINLGEDILDSNGNPHGSNLSMDKQGNFSAAGGNFKVTGGSGADKGAFTNTVGNTTLQTDNAGASMKFDNTAAEGGVTSEVAVGKNKATVAAGDKASFVANTDNGGSATITGGTQTVTTTGKGTVFENSAHKTPFVENGATTTIINGNEITTGKITTDQLVITGQGNAHGNGSIAFGGNGTIKSDINDGNYGDDGKPNGKNTSFETTLEGVNTKVTDGKITTENNVSAAGNSNTVTKDGKHKSEFNQGLTSIGGVVTNGEIKVAQKLDGATGLLTNEVTDANGSSKLEQSGTGLTYTDSANAGNATRIDSSDVSIGSKTDPDKRINLSDLGQIDELDKELTGRDEYKNNPTAVGGINAEAAIRREEVARLDGRINDVNDRVNKVGAMAAAIASLKSIGYDPQAPSEFSIGLGQYKGETGVAMGFFHYPNKNFMINVSLSTAGGETMGGIGATWRFGHKSPQKLLEEQREAQAKKELAAAEKYQAAAKLAKEAQERAEYAAKLARQAQVSADNAKAAADATQAKHFG